MSPARMTAGTYHVQVRFPSRAGGRAFNVQYSVCVRSGVVLRVGHETGAGRRGQDEEQGGREGGAGSEWLGYIRHGDEDGAIAPPRCIIQISRWAANTMSIDALPRSLAFLALLRTRRSDARDCPYSACASEMNASGRGGSCAARRAEVGRALRATRGAGRAARHVGTTFFNWIQRFRAVTRRDAPVRSRNAVASAEDVVQARVRGSCSNPGTVSMHPTSAPHAT